MDIRHLRVFMKVLEHGNITAAANDLGISQPALSKQLSRLEREFGLSLLERLPRGVQPSEHGKILEHYARSIDANYRSALRHLGSASGREDGEITIGAGFFWLQGPLPRAMARLSGVYPRAKIKIVGGVPEMLIELLLRGELDLVLGPVALAEQRSSRIRTISLIQTDTEILVRKDHPELARAKKSISDLTAMDWVLPEGTYVRNWFDQLFRYHGLVPPIPRIETNDVQCALSIVADSDLATLATSFSPAGQPWSRLTCLNCPELGSVRRTGILMAKDSFTPPLCDRFMEMLCETARDHPHAIAA